MIIHAILASHNRRDLTIESLACLIQAGAQSSVKTDIVLFDDGSTDGTAEAVTRNFENVAIVQGSGSAFWAAGMAAAEASVLARPDVQDTDFILWLNDDVEIDLDAFSRLQTFVASHPLSIVVGAVRDPDSGDLTYSGLRKSGWHPLNFTRVQPDASKLVEVDSFNGNVVLVPVGIARRLIGIDGGFSHAFADIDYGTRARRAGIDVWLAPGTFGVCPLNPAAPQTSVLTEWKKFTGTKGGGNLRSVSRILRRSNPVGWPAYIAVTYFLWWFRQIRSRIKGSSRLVGSRIKSQA